MAPHDALDGESLRAAVSRTLGDRAGHVVLVETTASTNDDAKRAAVAGAPARSIFVADAQTAGRGRQGRVWHSPPGDNLYLSIVLRPEAPPTQFAPFALLVGVAVAEEIDAIGGSPAARIKWPNDVWVGDKKIAGILIEASIAGGRVASLVVGIGVNVHTASFPGELATIATSLALLGVVQRDRARLAAGIARRVCDAEARFATAGLAPFLGDVRGRDALLGRPVRVESVEGVAAGIDEAGRLVVRTEDAGDVPVVAGHVELLDAS